ncbi:MAG: hypothetical protein RL397_637 [Pseudomonadota bacterium]
MNTRRLLLCAGVSGACATALSGCFPVVATGMVMGAFSLSDRRTTGAQAEDQAIELKAFDRLRDRFKGEKSISASVTSFNRIALLTGSVPNATVRAEAAGVISRIENVRLVINELQVGFPQSTTGYGSDVFLTSRVKLALLDDKAVNANFVKVITESSVVYLMGLVTEREATRAAEITSRVPGVRRVVKAFELISESQAQSLESAAKAGQALPETKGQNPQPSSAPPAAPAAPAPTPAPAPRPSSGVEVIPVR